MKNLFLASFLFFLCYTTHAQKTYSKAELEKIQQIVDYKIQLGELFLESGMKPDPVENPSFHLNVKLMNSLGHELERFIEEQKIIITDEEIRQFEDRVQEKEFLKIAGKYLTSRKATDLPKGYRGVNVQDSLALVAFYNATNGPNWTHKENWLTGPVATWYGITVEDDRVVRMVLSDSKISGAIPAAIGQLTALKNLYLSTYITGSIPAEIGNLNVLDSLYLSLSRITGSLPPQIGNLSSLEYFRYYNSNSTGIIPGEIGNLVNLKDLTISCNKMSRIIPPEIGNLVNLQRLVLSTSNDQNQIPPTIGNLTNLEYLSIVMYDALGNIPTEIGNLIKLENLYLGGQKITGSIPNSIGNLQSLTTLSIYGDSISGVIPTSIGNLSNLNFLTISGTKISGPIPSEISGLSNLYWLDLGDNLLSGPLPASMGELNELRELNLWNNQITGQIPPEIGNMSNLRILSCGSNNLSGPIPPEFGNLTNLRNFLLWGNQLSGSIPPELGNLTNLGNGIYGEGGIGGSYLSLGDNLLSGSIPVELSQLKSLEELSLSHNQLTGTIPPELAEMESLSGLRLGYNNLSGEIPPEIGQLSNLNYLELNNNNFNGEIPPEIGQLTKLYWIYLNDNNFSGIIPMELGNLSNIHDLFLDHNDFTGVLPYSFHQLKALQKLRFNSNYFVSPLSTGLLILDNLSEIRCDSNQFNATDCGTIRYIEDNITSNITHSPQITGFSFTDDCQVLAPPVNIEVQKLSDDLFFVNWDAPAQKNVIGYRLYRNDFLPIGGSMINNTFFVDQVDSMDVIKYHVTAIYSEGSSSIVSSDEMIVNQEAYNALAYFYNSTNGDNWTHSDNWFTGPISDWYGITIENGKINSIDFGYSGNNLKGILPNDIGYLINLQVLSLQSDSLYGNLPAQLFSLSNLKTLNLGGNKLSGVLPHQIGDLVSLETLSLANNLFSGAIPPEIGNLVNLQSLYLSNNNITGAIPSEIGNLVNLESLYLSNNNFTGFIPPEIGNLINLEKLSISNSGLTGTIPSEIGSLVSLWSLDLSNNDLTGTIPPEIGSLDRLWSLDLSTNSFSGTIPPEIGELSVLQDLYLSNNQFEGSIPSTFSDLSHVFIMELNNNNLSGIIPIEMCNNFSFYTVLSVSNNFYSFDACEEVDCLSGLLYWFVHSPQKNGFVFPDDCSSYVDAGEDTQVCMTSNNVAVAGSGLGHGQIVWATTGDGYFDNTTQLSTNYTFGEQDKINGEVRLKITATAIAPKTFTFSDSLKITFTPTPSTNAGTDIAICQSTTHQLAGTAQNYGTVTWTTSGTGTFNNPNSLTPIYTPSSYDNSIGTITLTLTGTALSPCTAVFSDSKILFIQKKPIANAGPDATICETNVHHLTGTASNYALINWSTAGNGTFTNSQSLTPNYDPGSNDIAAGTVILTLTAQAISPCAIASSNTMVLIIQKAPVVSAGSDATITENEVVSLNGTASNYTGVLWQTSGDGYFDNDGILNPVYNPGQNDIQNSIIVLNLIAWSNNSCLLPTVDFVNLTIKRQQIIQLNNGWNSLSSFVFPEEQAFDQVMAPVSGNLIIAKNMSQVYWPAYGINTIGNFETTEGYMVKMSGTSALPITGFQSQNKTIQLVAGWNILPVISDENVDSQVLLSQLGNNLVILTEIAGSGIIWPAEGVNSIPYLIPGKAYMVKVNSACSFTYQD